MAEPGSPVSDDAEHAPQLRQRDRHPNAARRRPHQDPPLRPRTHIQRGECLQRSENRRVTLSYPMYLLGGAATCSEGYVICFPEVPLAWAAWQLQYSPTAWGTLRQKFTKPSEQVAAPPSRNRFVLEIFY